MDVLSTTTTQAAANVTQTATQTDDTVLSSDFQTFLVMLTTQLENQDPLNPVESSDFAVQLATFSGVEQQVRTNDLLADMVSGLGASEISQLAGWVGMEARVSAQGYFDGTPIVLAPEPAPASDAANLVVRDATGQVVSREAMPLNAATVAWSGVGASGQTLSSGLYTFEVESLNGGEVTEVAPVEHYALIQEARTGSNGVDIVLPGGVSVSSADVQALRSPDDAS